MCCIFPCIEWLSSSIHCRFSLHLDSLYCKSVIGRSAKVCVPGSSWKIKTKTKQKKKMGENRLEKCAWQARGEIGCCVVLMLMLYSSISIWFWYARWLCKNEWRLTIAVMIIGNNFWPAICAQKMVGGAEWFCKTSNRYAIIDNGLFALAETKRKWSIEHNLCFSHSWSDQ